MSNLVLPNQYQNETLEKNLTAFFKKYPWERERLEPVLRKAPEKKYKLEDCEIPPVPSKPPIRITLLLGIGNPQLIAKMLNDQVFQRECFKLFIFENDPDFLAAIFQETDLTQIISYNKTEWFLMHNPNSIKGHFFRALKPEAVTSMMLNVQAFSFNQNISEEAKSFYDVVPALYNETVGHVIHNNGNLDDSLFGVEVTLRNKDFLLNKPGIKDLKGYYSGLTAVIVGAGHTLDSSLETLSKHRDKVVMIAADAALKPLLAAGIEPDYVVSIERLNGFQKPFFENLPPVKSEMIAFPVVHPEVLSSFPGKVRLVYRNYGFYAYFEKALPKGLLRCGGSASHLGIRLADYFGCRNCVLIGLDSCYEEKDGKFRSHCKNGGHADWSEYYTLEHHQTVRNHAPAFKVPANSGELVMTNMTYYQWAKEISEEVSFLSQRMTIKNAALNGVAIGNVPYVPLEQAIGNLDPIVLEKPEAPSHVDMTRKWDNKALMKNFEAWLKISEESLKECDELLKLEGEIPLSRFQALMYVWNFRFCMDDLFVSFVIQCCATLFFQLENKWWSYSLFPDADVKEKVQCLKDRFDLFKITLTRLIDIFKREGKPSGTDAK